MLTIFPGTTMMPGTTTRLSLGLLDGRNVWAADLDAALACVDAARSALGDDRLTIAPSCSLLHLPYEAAQAVDAQTAKAILQLRDCLEPDEACGAAPITMRPWVRSGAASATSRATWPPNDVPPTTNGLPSAASSTSRAQAAMSGAAGTTTRQSKSGRSSGISGS